MFGLCADVKRMLKHFLKNIILQQAYCGIILASCRADAGMLMRGCCCRQGGFFFRSDAGPLQLLQLQHLCLMESDVALPQQPRISCRFMSHTHLIQPSARIHLYSAKIHLWRSIWMDPSADIPDTLHQMDSAMHKDICNCCWQRLNKTY